MLTFIENYLVLFSYKNSKFTSNSESYLINYISCYDKLSNSNTNVLFSEIKGNVQKTIFNYYFNYLKDLLSPKNIEFNLKDSVLNLELYNHQLKDLKQLLYFENTVHKLYVNNQRTNYEPKIYYNEHQSGKSFVILELTNYQIPKIEQQVNKYNNCNIIVVNSKSSFTWINKLKYKYKENYLIVKNKTSLNEFNKIKFEECYFRVILVLDTYYDKVITKIESQDVYLSRIFYDSFFTLKNIKHKNTPKKIINTYLVTNNIYNCLVPNYNCILQTKNYTSQNFIKDFLERLFNCLEDITRIDLIINTFNFVIKCFNEDKFDSNISQQYFRVLINLNQIDLDEFNNHNDKKVYLYEKREISKNKCLESRNNLVLYINNLVIGFNKVDNISFINKNIYPVKPLQIRKTVDNDVLKCLEEEKFLDAILMTKMKITSIQNILEDIKPKPSEEVKTNIIDRITDKVCLVCY